MAIALVLSVAGPAACGFLDGHRNDPSDASDGGLLSVVVSEPDASESPGATDASLPLDQPSPATPHLVLLLTDTDHQALAVDGDGALYAVGANRSKLLVSHDGKLWEQRGSLDGHRFQCMAVLSDGVLLADSITRGGHVIARSSDHGKTWTDVLSLADPYVPKRLLQPHGIAELGGAVFLAEYQVATDDPVPIHLWVSEDRGLTWAVHYTFQGYRHAHSLLADAATGTLWAFMGDRTGAMLRSTDGGRSWSIVVPAPRGVIVDAVQVPDGLLFGTDGLYQPAFPHIERLVSGDRLEIIDGLPCPSYSILAVPGGGFLLGTTHETGGDVYPPSDGAAHLLGSADGRTWTGLLAYDRARTSDYGRLDVHWVLPDGRVVVEFTNARGLGTGFHLVRLKLR